MKMIEIFLILILILVKEIYSYSETINICYLDRYNSYVPMINNTIYNSFPYLDFNIGYKNVNQTAYTSYTLNNCDIAMIEPDFYYENYSKIASIIEYIEDQLEERQNDLDDGEIFQELLKDLRVNAEEDETDLEIRALPLFMDYGILYYRNDIYEEPPKTYNDLYSIMGKLSALDDNKRVKDGLGTINEKIKYVYVGQFNDGNEFYYNLIENVLNTNDTINYNVIEREVKQALIQFKQLFDSEMIEPTIWTVKSENSATNFISGDILYMRNWSSYSSNIYKGFNSKLDGSTFKISNILYSERNGNSRAVNKGIYLCVITNHGKYSDDEYEVKVKNSAELIKIITSKEFMKSLINENDFYDIPVYHSLISEDTQLNNTEYCKRINCPFFRNLQNNHIIAGYNVINQGNFTKKFNDFYEKHLRSYLKSGNENDSIENIMSKFSDYFEDKYVKFGSKTSIVMIIIIAIEIAITLLVAYYIIKYRNFIEIRRSSPLFLIFMLFGIILSFISILTFIGKPSDFICIIKPFIFVLAFGLTFYSLLLKTFRIKVIFDKVNIQVKDSYLVFYLCILLGIELVLVTIWSIFAGMESKVKPVSDEMHYYYCKNTKPLGKSIEIFLTVINGIALMYGCYLAYKVKNVYSEYNESKIIGLSIYGIVICMVILMFIVNINSLDHLTLFIIESLMIILSADIILIFMFTPKLWKLHINKISEPPYDRPMYIY